MTKSELIAKLAARFPQLVAKDAELAVKMILDAMGKSLAQGQRIEIRGFGSFGLNYRPPRTGRNPKSGDRVQVPAKYVPQMAWQLACTGRKWVDFVSYDDRLEDESKHLFIVRYHRDDEYIAEIEAAVIKLLEEVEAKVAKFKEI